MYEKKENKGNVLICVERRRKHAWYCGSQQNQTYGKRLVGNVNFFVASIQKQDPASGGDFVAFMEPVASIITSMFSGIARLSECIG